MRKIIITAISVLSILFVFAGCGSDDMKDMGSDIRSSVNSAGDRMESGLNDIESGIDNSDNMYSSERNNNN